MLQIKNLKVSVSAEATTDKNIEKKEILKGVNVEIKLGEIHAVMGPNGSGKSTLASAIAGHPRYEITGGKIVFEEEDLSILAPEERSLMGVFLCFQYPLAIPGVTVSNFLRMAYNERYGVIISPLEFHSLLEEEVEKVGLNKNFITRYLNDGFSGGEKKKMEMLQMRILQPKLALLDETDSGLDVDALKLVAKTILDLKKGDAEFSSLIITHQRKILDYINPDVVHIMIDGKIVKSGGKEIVDLVEERGYEQFK